MNNHTEIIQHYIDKNSYQSFLEIGYGAGTNFNAIRAKEKTSVDPEMYKEARHKNQDENIHFVELDSDTFFSELDKRKKYSCIFIDGSHMADQVYRDIQNSLKHLKKGGVILIHDLNPPNEVCTRVPRETREWCGTAFKAFYTFMQHNPTALIGFHPQDYGTAVIYHQEGLTMGELIEDVTYEQYKNWLKDKEYA